MSNLPPGVSDHDIPGNCPDDVLEDQLRERLLDVLADFGLDIADVSDKVWETFDMHADGLLDLVIRYRSEVE